MGITLEKYSSCFASASMMDWLRTLEESSVDHHACHAHNSVSVCARQQACITFRLSLRALDFVCIAGGLPTAVRAAITKLKAERQLKTNQAATWASAASSYIGDLILPP